jgi:hypothetical protein
MCASVPPVAVVAQRVLRAQLELIELVVGLDRFVLIVG